MATCEALTAAVALQADLGLSVALNLAYHSSQVDTLQSPLMQSMLPMFGGAEKVAADVANSREIVRTCVAGLAAAKT
jgi:hypothetical protein